MVVIRLARGGRVKQAVYRIVAADKRRASTGKFLDILGTYNPHTKEVKLNTELIEKYLSSGAQPSDRVLRILQHQGVATPGWAKTHDRFKKSKNEAEESTDNDAVKPTSVAPSESVEDKKQSIDDPETAATEEKVAVDQKEATEDVAKAAEKTEDKAEDKA